MTEATMETTQNAVAMSVQDTLRDLAQKVRYTVAINVQDVTHAESLTQPRPAGNCSNWVLGHLLAVYSKVLPMLGEQSAIAMDRIKRYDRYSAPMTDGAEAIPFDELVAAWGATCDRVDAGINRMSDEMLRQPVPESPSANPNETMHSLLFTIMFHQAYHSGQLGLLRRMVGREGAIK